MAQLPDHSSCHLYFNLIQSPGDRIMNCNEIYVKVNSKDETVLFRVHKFCLQLGVIVLNNEADFPPKSTEMKGKQGLCTLIRTTEGSSELQ